MNTKLFIAKANHRIVEKTNPFFGPIRRKIGGITSDFTIISNNCWAGSVYRWFHIPYLTPTAGLYFYPEDFLRFCTNLHRYLSMDVKQITLSQSKYENIMRAKGQVNVPIGKIDDVEIIFLHYGTFQEAREKWLRRAARVNWKNLIVKNSEMNGCTESHVKCFDALPIERKFIFTTKDYGLESQVIFKEYMGEEQIKDDTTMFNKYINVNALVSGRPFKIRQK